MNAYFSNVLGKRFYISLGILLILYLPIYSDAFGFCTSLCGYGLLHHVQVFSFNTLLFLLALITPFISAFFITKAGQSSHPKLYTFFAIIGALVLLIFSALIVNIVLLLIYALFPSLIIGLIGQTIVRLSYHVW